MWKLIQFDMHLTTLCVHKGKIQALSLVRWWNSTRPRFIIIIIIINLPSEEQSG